MLESLLPGKSSIGAHVAHLNSVTPQNVQSHPKSLLLLLQSDDFSLLWMVANLRSNAGMPPDLLNGQEVASDTISPEHCFAAAHNVLHSAVHYALLPSSYALFLEVCFSSIPRYFSSNTVQCYKPDPFIGYSLTIS
jgi:hypothetical protein